MPCLRAPPHLVVLRALGWILVWALKRLFAPQLILFWELHASDGGSEPGCLAVGPTAKRFGLVFDLVGVWQWVFGLVFDLV